MFKRKSNNYGSLPTYEKPTGYTFLDKKVGRLPPEAYADTRSSVGEWMALVVLITAIVVVVVAAAA